MPHPTPVQIAYGSATVISTTLLLLLLAPDASPAVVSLIAVGALLLGVTVALLLRPRRPRSTVPPEPGTVPAQHTGPQPAAAGVSPYATYREHRARATVTRPEVSV